ncbi:RES domain-containing protein [Bifidobacterium sp. ESL0775]|uniref:RES domain-containing protein n=1 Tax=Bifidobacterium sp. ESL0775 TaxID=2983230 RepID=UPI0023F75560|nr:RES domain-containing protein [Bifidobacterium sp. ESL0775]WEV69080.1 RES domain-containing protein [Bifidobacterium sp. ESL0775]
MSDNTMFCCSNCFGKGMKDIVEGAYDAKSPLGDCPYCGSSNIRLYEIEKHDELQTALYNVISLYVLDSKAGEPMSTILQSDWNIFSNKVNNPQRLLSTLFDSLMKKKLEPSNFPTQKFKLGRSEEKPFLENGSWDDFSNHIKYKNRFHIPFIHLEAIQELLLSLVEDVDDTNSDGIFYRGRIADDKAGFKENEMGAPPQKVLVSAGRVNPSGIRELYLCGDKDTVPYEVRATVPDYVTIGKFKCKDKNKKKVLNLSKIDDIVPDFSNQHALRLLAVNKPLLHDFAQEVAKPVSSNPNAELNYLPTQYIAEFIKSLNDTKRQRIDGVCFKSTMHPPHMNYCFFDPNDWDCVKVETIQIKKIDILVG